MSKGVLGLMAKPISLPAAAPLSWAGPAVLLFHPVPSCCLAEAASQQAERKNCAYRQEIEQPSLAKGGYRDIKGEKAHFGCGSAAV